MTILSQSRCDTIMKLAESLDRIMAGGRLSRSDLSTAVHEWITAVEEVNAALADVEKLLAAGLRDEAMSMHHPDLLKVARRMSLRQRSDWTRLHGWMLEHGVPVPPDVDVGAAEQMAAAAAEVEQFRPQLDRLRHMALANAGLEARLEALWDVRDRDPSSPVWLAEVDTYEHAVLDDLRGRVATARRAGDIDRLAAIEQLLGDFRWSVEIPEAIRNDVAGAGGVARLRELSTEAAALAAELVRTVPHLTPGSGPRLATAIGVRDRLEAVIGEFEMQEAELAALPGMLAMFRQTGGARDCREARDRIASELERLQALETEDSTRTAFVEACQTLEFLADHPPAASGEIAWLADLQRAEMEARHACQQLADLAISPLLAERVRRAVASIDSRQAMRRRFTLLVAACIVLAFLGMTAIVGWFIWRRGEQERVDERLESALTQAEAGGFRERPEWLAGLVGGTDRRVAATIAKIDAAIAAEHARAAHFEERLAAAVDAIDALEDEVEQRGAGALLGQLDAWPASYEHAVVALREARRSGGLPAQRWAWGHGGGQAGSSVSPPEAAAPRLPPDAAERFDDEEARFARVEVQLLGLEQRLERLADKAVQASIDGIEETLADSRPAVLTTTRARLRRLRELAAADKTPTGGLPGRRSSRASEASLAALAVVEKRLEVVGRARPPETTDRKPGDDF